MVPNTVFSDDGGDEFIGRHVEGGVAHGNAEDGLSEHLGVIALLDGNIGSLCNR